MEFRNICTKYGHKSHNFQYKEAVKKQGWLDLKIYHFLGCFKYLFVKDVREKCEYLTKASTSSSFVWFSILKRFLTPCNQSLKKYGYWGRPNQEQKLKLGFWLLFQKKFFCFLLLHLCFQQRIFGSSSIEIFSKPFKRYRTLRKSRPEA